MLTLIGHVQAELDEVLAEDCVLCGELVIDTVDVPFFPEEREYDLMMQTWALPGASRAGPVSEDDP